MKTKIVINGRFLTQKITGVQRYALELIKTFDNMIATEQINPDKYEIIIYAPQNIKYQINLKKIQIKKVGFLKGYLWEQIELPIYSAGKLLLNLCNIGPLLKYKQIITMHDVAFFVFPNAFSMRFRLLYKILFRILSKISRVIITVSSFSRGELIKYCNLSPSKIRSIYIGVDHIKRIEEDKNIINQYSLNNKSYILAVSSLNPNKNFISIIQALQYINNDLKLIIVGGENKKIFNNINVPVSDKVKHLGYISNEELKALYKHASCFVFPSLYEGFGLPPLEAMACGCPVIVSDRASLPEVCGEAAMYCNPNNPKDIAEKISFILNHKDFRESMRIKGIKQSKKFTWEKCAKETFAVIEEVLYR